MLGGSFIIKVEKVRQGARIPVGLVSPPLADRAVIGRSKEADFQLADPSVSSRHVLLETHEEGFRVTALTTRGSTYVNRTQLQPGDVELVRDEQSWLQVGRALLHVTLTVITLSDEQPPMSLPSLAALSLSELRPLLHVTPGDPVQVWIKGQSCSSYPTALRVLACLAETPGEVVSHHTLLEAMSPSSHQDVGGGNLNQTVTYIRNMFHDVLEQGHLQPKELAKLIRASAPGRVTDASMSPRALLRCLIESVRGVGYRLCLPPHAVSIGPAIEVY